MIDYSKLTDKDLLAMWEKNAWMVSYYNAAEGRQWYNEAEERAEARAEFRKVSKELDKRRLDPPKGEYLL